MNHEKLVADIVTRCIGMPFIFFPQDQTMSPESRKKREPADLCFVVGRSAFLVKCTVGSKDFHAATKHNMDQLNYWCSRWNDDHCTLKTSGLDNSTVYHRSEIDHVFLVSVVGGDKKSVVVDALNYIKNSTVVTAAISIHDSLLMKLGGAGLSPADLVDLFTLVICAKKELGEDFIEWFIRTYQRRLLSSVGYADCLTHEENSVDRTVLSHAFSCLKAATKHGDVEFFDLGISEITWLILQSRAVLAATHAGVEGLGNGKMAIIEREIEGVYYAVAAVPPRYNAEPIADIIFPRARGRRVVGVIMMLTAPEWDTTPLTLYVSDGETSHFRLNRSIDNLLDQVATL